MTTRTRDWIKLSGLVALALVLALAFAGAVNLPRRSEAQQALANVAPAQLPSIPAAKPPAGLSEAFRAGGPGGGRERRPVAPPPPAPTPPPVRPDVPRPRRTAATPGAARRGERLHHLVRRLHPDQQPRGG